LFLSLRLFSPTSTAPPDIYPLSLHDALPILADFQQLLGAPVILMGFGLNTDGAHGPDEHFYIDLFHKGIDASIHFLKNIAGASRSEEHTSELQSRENLVCRLLLEKKKIYTTS